MKRVHEETHEAARYAATVKWWRQRVAHLTVVEVAHRTGYSGAAIYRLERGYNTLGKPIKLPAWRRYFKALQRVAQSKNIKGPGE
ncbi:MAG TPA: hypothetical protein VF748_14640 [Candidatus Acidoferrum sp.]